VSQAVEEQLNSNRNLLSAPWSLVRISSQSVPIKPSGGASSVMSPSASGPPDPKQRRPIMEPIWIGRHPKQLPAGV
jgi:hypothetical protein